MPRRFFGNPNCYARALGDCSARINREHYVSSSVLSDVAEGEASVLVQNLGFQQKKGELEGRGISSLVARVLCEKHNEALGPFDATGCGLFAAMDRINSTIASPVRQELVTMIDGHCLERWMLKTLCGGLYSGNLPTPDGRMKGICPPRLWLDALYRDGDLPVGQGLYLKAGSPGVAFSTEPMVLKLKAEVDQANIIIGLTTWLFNFEFILVLATLPEVCPPNLEDSHYRPKALVFEGKHKRIEFDWGTNTGSDPVRVMWLGPERVDRHPTDI